ncbi:uncharacterized protein LOC113354415 [Papaver somniferum]|uniref:uncharacterized protein LOC113354415 n=1 Tax=Papaver somniferum TaxID=3469 RepID=UPI000E704B3F|nr:uncharacterized protein LOC113354415 [Papaver somniferum]
MMEEKLLALSLSKTREGSDDGQSDNRLPPVPSVAPWLVIPFAKGTQKQAFYHPCELKSRTHYKSIPELNGKRFWQKNSHQGWLVIVCHDRRYDYNDENSLPANSKFGDCFLWNPITLKIFRLPSIFCFLSKYNLIMDCALSSPTSTEEVNDSMVYFNFLRRDKLDGGIRDRHVLVYSTLREQQWCESALYEDDFDDIVFPFGSLVPVHQGKLNAMGTHGHHLEIEKQQDKTLVIRQFNTITDNFYQHEGSGPSSHAHYVEICDEIYRVDLNFSGDVVTSVEIFKLDFTLMAWVEVNSLGDHVVFLSPYTNFSCSAAKMGFTRGCVYYIPHEDKNFYMFDVEDNCIKIVSPCIMKCAVPLYTSSWLMIPATEITVERKTAIEDWFCEVKEEEEDHKQEQLYETVVACEETNSSIIISENRSILDVLSTLLHPVDFIHFRSTCKAIQSKFPARSWRSSSTLTKTATYLSLWLVFSKDKDTFFSFVNPEHKSEKYFLSLSELLIGAMIRFSKDGWLLMSKGKHIIFFYNPFTRETIKLPDLPDKRWYNFRGISFSCLPTSPDCTVFAISISAPNEITIATIKRGNNSWTFHHVPAQGNDEPGMSSCFNSPVFCHGAFRCLDYNGILRSFNLDGSYMESHNVSRNV